ncbi:MAG: AbrB/MazE/SpoVT family DNA-binding domain-containing protein [Sphaerochaetaceae bacterium]
MDMQVLSVSSKGQVVLPMEMRKKLSIGNGTRLAAYSSGDVIMLKVVKLPTIEDFNAALDKAQEWAASVGLKEEEVNKIIKDVRQRKREKTN